jgi:hypothetical protein
MIIPRSIRTAAFAALLAATTFAAPPTQPAAPGTMQPQASFEFDFLISPSCAWNGAGSATSIPAAAGSKARSGSRAR